MNEMTLNGDLVIKAIIFDLDNCLVAGDEMGRELFEPAFAAIRQANQGSWENSKLELAFEDCWRHPFDSVAERHGFSPPMREAGWRVFSQLEVLGPMRGYGDLDLLPRLSVPRFLVTSGFRKLQESKIRSLKFAPLFAGIFVDALGEPNRRGKQGIFDNILQDFGLESSQTLVVGDNPDSEITAGNNLRMPTAQILRPGVTCDPRARFHVRNLHDVAELAASPRLAETPSHDANSSPIWISTRSAHS